MRAVIMEIHKDYCIVMTRDGQFLKQEIPAGVFEVGDEIVVSKSYSYRPKAVRVSWLRNFAVAAMVVVVVAVGSIFGVWYLKQYRPLREVTMLTEEEAGEAVPAPVEEEAQAEGAQEKKGTEESILTTEAEQGKSIIFEKTYSLVEQPEFEERIEDIISFSYEVIDEINLQVKFRNISSTYSFSGTFILTILLSDGSVSQTKDINLEGFEPAQVSKIYPFLLKAGETGLKLEVKGSAY
jgi:hypothetical protein